MPSTKTFYVTRMKAGSLCCGRVVEPCPDCRKSAIRDGRSLYIHALVFKRKAGFVDEYMIGAACGSNLPWRMRLRLWLMRMKAKLYVRLGIKPRMRPGIGDGFPVARATKKFNPKNLKESA